MHTTKQLWRLALIVLCLCGGSSGYIAGNESMNLVTTPENRPTIHGFMLVEGKVSSSLSRHSTKTI
jgi:hypothetical protein